MRHSFLLFKCLFLEVNEKKKKKISESSRILVEIVSVEDGFTKPVEGMAKTNEHKS